MSKGTISEFAPHWRKAARGTARDEADDPFRLDLTTVPAAPHVARYKARIILAQWHVSQENTDTALLLISELVTNAVQFGRTPRMAFPLQISLALWRMRDILVIEVSDQSADVPVRRSVSPDSESGRGLNMVHELSRQWGSYVSGPGWKTVYCVISI